MRTCHSLLVLACLFTVLNTACTSPARRIEQIAKNLGYTPVSLVGGGFILSAYRNNVSKPLPTTLHVYIEGDGLPWLTPTIVSSDPTPRNALMLELMAIDHTPSLYLGRPCYFGHAEDSLCEPTLWTDRRYSPLVVDTMSSALRRFLSSRQYEQLVFIGHSGGGALALLIANQFEETALVVTIAGNLDTDAWTRLHGFTPLTGSLNPAAQKKNRPFPEFHYLGFQDTDLPPSVFGAIANKRPNATVVVVNDADHACCWAQIWREQVMSLPQ